MGNLIDRTLAEVRTTAGMPARYQLISVADFISDVKISAALEADAYECKYMLKGDVEYQVGEETFTLHEGDTLFFDGRTKHRLKNIGPDDALILAFYLF